ncbi:MAG: Ankyrin repeat domain-containing protein 44 [Geoglossum simile]|nr:MAG: Ankyrin repeat domain-containing protein 44 [Geoglossum simile]
MTSSKEYNSNNEDSVEIEDRIDCINDMHLKVVQLLAARRGYLEIVEYLKKNGSNINLQGDSGWTPLFYAIAGGHNDTVKFLLGEKAGLKVKDSHGKVPLTVAAQYAPADIFEQLLQVEGIELNPVDNVGRTPLAFVASRGNEEVVALLLGKDDTEVNSVDDNRHTPLWDAEWRGHTNIASLLRVEGARLTPHKRGTTPLTLAMRHSDASIVD